ncbi:tetratricopeptide repeat protein [Anaeramoeba ignava]|uniref:Tetratricopeptide repeat protein 29 n=1 Tax=Anaeramoeba ignava TaxID=1746090 RepID=A0A9Q0RAS1_ANAIG|nr:tetratricopeptide repeat protein [Anaeramoeba ignava]
MSFLSLISKQTSTTKIEFDKALIIAKENNNENQICQALGKLTNFFYSSMQNINQALKYSQMWAESSQKCQDLDMLRDSLSTLCCTYFSVNQKENAEDICAQFKELLIDKLELDKSSKSIKTLISNHGTLGLLYQTIKEQGKALEIFQKGYQLAKQNPEIMQDSVLSKFMDEIYKNALLLGKFSDAFSIVKEKISLLEKQNQKAKLLDLLEEIASLNSLIGWPHESARMLENALEVAQKISEENPKKENIEKEFSISIKLGETMGIIDHFPKAIKYLNEALSKAQAIKDQVNECKIIDEIAKLYASYNQYSETLIKLNELMSKMEEYKIDNDRVSIIYRIAEANYKIGNYKKAQEFVSKCLSNFQETNFFQIKSHPKLDYKKRGTIIEYDAYLLSFQIESALNNYKSALQAGLKAIDLVNDGVLDRKYSWNQTKEYIEQERKASKLKILEYLNPIAIKAGEFEKAEQMIQETINLGHQVKPEHSILFQSAYSLLAELHMKNSKPELAVSALEKALEYDERLLDFDKCFKVIHSIQIAKMLEMISTKKNFESIKEYYNQAFDIMKRMEPEELKIVQEQTFENKSTIKVKLETQFKS